MAQITGNLLDPIGKPIVGAIIRITSDSTETVLYGVEGKETTQTGGLYDFTLNNGNYLIEVLFDGVYIRNAVVLIDSSIPSVLDLETLIKNHATFVPSTIDS